MKFETPEVTVLTSAINAIQTSPKNGGNPDGGPQNDSTAYDDME